jgi:Ni/Co efflux regulator RcnB
MKGLPILVAALSLLTASMATVTSQAVADHVVIHKPQHTVVVRKPSPIVRHSGRDRFVWRRPAPRPGHYWHRGNWFVRIHGPSFHWPLGWHYRVIVIGAVLPPIFLEPEYYYDDYAALGLQVPPPGYRWVRYGDDLLLVNLRTGEVEDVINDVFD